MSAATLATRQGFRVAAALCALLLGCVASAAAQAPDRPAPAARKGAEQPATLPPLDSQPEPGALAAQEGGAINKPIEDPDAPLYSPFTARYILDEVRNLRIDLERTRADLIERQVNREYTVAANATGYAQRAVELFFYLITGVTTVLVFLGWNSLREVRSRVGQIAETRVDELVRGYAERLDAVEAELQNKSQRLHEAQHEIDITNELHALWLRASQETTPPGKIAVYDEIMKLRPDDVQALTYKTDAALQLGEAQWALSLANRALDIEPQNGHAFYLRACAYAATGAVEEAMADLTAAVGLTDAYREEALRDPAFAPLREREDFKALTQAQSQTDTQTDSGGSDA